MATAGMAWTTVQWWPITPSALRPCGVVATSGWCLLRLCLPNGIQLPAEAGGKQSCEVGCLIRKLPPGAVAFSRRCSKFTHPPALCGTTVQWWPITPSALRPCGVVATSGWCLLRLCLPNGIQLPAEAGGKQSCEVGCLISGMIENGDIGTAMNLIPETTSMMRTMAILCVLRSR